MRKEMDINKIWLKQALVLTLILFLSACAGLPKPQPDLSNPIRTVAILPFENGSNNIDAPNKLRELFKSKFGLKFYKVLAIEEVDQILLDDFGITLGEHFEDVDFEEIKAKIGADAYVFGNITHFDQTIAGIINIKRVRAEMKMMQASNNEIVWNVSKMGIKSEAGSGDGLGALASLASDISDAAEEGDINWIKIKKKNSDNEGGLLGNLIVGLVDAAIDSATDNVLSEESIAFVNRSTSNLRHGPGY